MSELQLQVLHTENGILFFILELSHQKGDLTDEPSYYRSGSGGREVFWKSPSKLEAAQLGLHLSP